MQKKKKFTLKERIAFSIKKTMIKENCCTILFYIEIQVLCNIEDIILWMSGLN